MTQSAIINPVTLPEQLGAAERHFVECMAKGEPCIISEELPKEPVKTGEKANVVRASVIRFFAWGGDEINPIRGNLISLRGAWVPKKLDLANVPMPYSVEFLNCRFNAEVLMPCAECRSLTMDHSHLSAGFVGEGMKISNAMLMRGVFIPKGEVQLLQAKVGGEFDCSGSTFKNKGGYALSADKIQVGGNVVMEGSFAEGEVRFLTANVNGNMSCDGSAFENEGGVAFVADRIKIAGNLHLRDGFSTNGEARLAAADIGLTFSCRGGSFINKQGNAILVDEARIGGTVSFRDNFLAEGTVNLLRAHIGGDMYCTNGAFMNETGKAIVADGVKINGGLFLHKGFTAHGKIQVVYADIGGNLRCDGGDFNNGIVLEGTQIGESMIWRNANGGGQVHLAFASANVFDYDQISQEKFNFILDGFSYKQFSKYMDAQSRINWLCSRPKGVPFSPQPFEQAAKVLFAMGYSKDARKILLEKEEQLTKYGQMPPLRRIARKILGAYTGYGYGPLRALLWLFAIITTGAIMYDVADYTCRILPSEAEVITNEDYRRAQVQKCAMPRQPTAAVEYMFPSYKQFQPVIYSIDVFIPFSILHQEPYWHPQKGAGDAFALLLLVWYWFEIVIGYVFFYGIVYPYINNLSWLQSNRK